MVLVNFGVLTTGFDAPKGECRGHRAPDEIIGAVQPDGRPCDSRTEGGRYEKPVKS